MVIVTPSQYIYMQSYACRLAEALQSMMDHLGTQSANLLILEAEFTHKERTIGKINDGAGKGFIEGRVAGAEAGKASSIAKSIG